MVPLSSKAPNISRADMPADPAAYATNIARQLNVGVSSVSFVEVDSAEELRQGIAAMRFKANGGVRPEDVGNAPKYWGISEAEYRRKADVWPLNPNGELVAYAIVENGKTIATTAFGVEQGSGSRPFATSTPLRIASVTCICCMPNTRVYRVAPIAQIQPRSCKSAMTAEPHGNLQLLFTQLALLLADNGIRKLSLTPLTVRQYMPHSCRIIRVTSLLPNLQTLALRGLTSPPIAPTPAPTNPSWLCADRMSTLFTITHRPSGQPTHMMAGRHSPRSKLIRTASWAGH